MAAVAAAAGLAVVVRLPLISVAEASTTASPAPQRWLQSRPAGDDSLDEVVRNMDHVPDFYEWWPASFRPYWVEQDIMNEVNFRIVQQQRIHGDITDLTVVRKTPVRYIDFLKNPDSRQLDAFNKGDAAIVHGADYWRSASLQGIGELNPKLFLPAGREDLAKGEGMLVIHAVKKAGVFYVTTLTTSHKDGSKVSADLFYDYFPEQGILFEDYGRALDKDGKLRATSKTGFAVWPVDPPDLISFSRPALLALEAQLGRLTLQNIDSFPGTSSAAQDRFDEVVRIMKFLEAFLDQGGVAVNWQKKLIKDWQLGLSDGYIFDQNPLLPRYRSAVRKLVELVDRIGVGEAIERYKTDPLKLFEGIVTVTKTGSNSKGAETAYAVTTA